MVTLRFFGGTIELSGLRDSAPELSPGYPWDPRTACHRVPAIAYADLLRTLVRQKVEVDDQARQYATLTHGALVHRQAGQRPPGERHVALIGLHEADDHVE